MIFNEPQPGPPACNKRKDQISQQQKEIHPGVSAPQLDPGTTLPKTCNAA